jgi:hypothetical protein
MKHSFALVLFFSISMSACSTINGPSATVTRHGPNISENTDHDNKHPYPFFDQFYRDFGEIDRKTTYDIKHMSVDDQQNFRDQESKSKKLLIDGFTVINMNCADYFASAGKDERYIIFGRDVSAYLGSIAAGTLAAASRASTTTVAGIALGTGGIVSGADIFRKDFLYNVENIDAVRTLIQAALLADQKQLTKNTDDMIAGTDDIYTWKYAMQDLAEDQMKCEPSGIETLAREAIKNGTVEAINTSTTTPTSTKENTTAGQPATGNQGAANGNGNLLSAPIQGLPGGILPATGQSTANTSQSTRTQVKLKIGG